ncbi:MAG TPA: hypothetical protein ENH91_15010 [Leeuwenhoekiella sp.]|nr:hypothetical protein [Leeuwenhoekiella sp.]
MAVVAMGMISFSANAQEEKTTTETMDPTTQTMQVNDNFEKIDKSQLPQAVKDAIMTDMDGMMVKEAYVGEDTVYKIVVALMTDDTQTKTVYADAEGHWIKPKKDNMN